jgi:hypothetical protein
MTYRIFAVLFLWCAYLQINDPDPLLWIFIYCTASISFELAARDIIYPKISLMIGAVFAIYAISLFPNEFVGFWGDMEQNQNIEYARESVGLFIISGSQLYLFFLNDRKKDKRP